MKAMRWTRTKPIRPGFYWWRQFYKQDSLKRDGRPGYCHPRVIEIFYREGNRAMEIWAKEGMRQWPLTDWFRSGDIFAGPIPMPEYEYVPTGKKT